MMKTNRVFSENGHDFTALISQAIEAELVKMANQKYNSGKDIAAIEKEDK